MPKELQDVEISRCVITEDFNTREKGLGDLEGLVISVKKQGVLEPLLGKQLENKDKSVEVYAGFRRLEAAKIAGLKTVPIIVLPRRRVSRKQMLLANVTENVRRRNLNPVDEAIAYQRMQRDHGMSKEDICAELGLKKELLEKRFSLLKLTPTVRDALHEDRITMVAALDIDRLPADKQDKYVTVAEELRGKKLTKMIDAALEKIKKQTEMTDPTPPKDPADVSEHVKRIRKCSAVVCTGLGYEKEQIEMVKGVNFRPLDPDDLKVVAQLFEHCADHVEDDIPMNDKAAETVVEYVEGTPKNVRLNIESPVVRQALIHAISDAATTMARDRGAEKGKRARVTHALVKAAIDEFYTPINEAPVEDGKVIDITSK